MWPFRRETWNLITLMLMNEGYHQRAERIWLPRKMPTMAKFYIAMYLLQYCEQNGQCKTCKIPNATKDCTQCRSNTGHLCRIYQVKSNMLFLSESSINVIQCIALSFVSPYSHSLMKHSCKWSMSHIWCFDGVEDTHVDLVIFFSVWMSARWA